MVTSSKCLHLLKSNLGFFLVSLFRGKLGRSSRRLSSTHVKVSTAGPVGFGLMFKRSFRVGRKRGIREEKGNSPKLVRRLDDGFCIYVDRNIGKVLNSIELGKFVGNSSFNVGVVSRKVFKFKVHVDYAGNESNSHVNVFS